MKSAFFYKTIPFTIFLYTLVMAAAGLADPAIEKMTPGKKETCPVCGMFVSLYPDWIAAVTLENGITRYFDGAKDMFKYLLDKNKWEPEFKSAAAKSIRVTDYYTLDPIDAQKAFFVIGSDVLGPMGHELIPVKTRDDAKEFLKDHKGTKIIEFNDVNPGLLEKLDHGNF